MKELYPYLMGAGGAATLLFLLKWLRDALVKKDSTDVNKTRADTDKTNAESHEIRARADVLITDGALRIVDRLSSDLDEARDEIERLINVITESQKMFDQSKIDFALQNNSLREKLEEAKVLMETKKRHCVEMKSRMEQLRDLLLLKQNGGLTREQLDEFVKKLDDLINPEA